MGRCALGRAPRPHPPPEPIEHGYGCCMPAVAPLDRADGHLNLWQATQVMAWLEAARRRDVSPDTAADYINARSALPGTSTRPGRVTWGEDTFSWTSMVTRFVSTEPQWIRLLLPRSGDTRGLHKESLVPAITAGAAVVWGHRAGERGVTPPTHVLVSTAGQHALDWRVRAQNDPIDEASIAGPEDADRQLKRAVLVATQTLDDLDLVPQDAASLRTLERLRDRFASSQWPDWLGAAHSKNRVGLDLAIRGLSLATAASIAQRTDGPAFSASLARDRAAILAELDRAARRSVEAVFASDGYEGSLPVN